MKMEDMRKTDGRRRARKRIEAKNALEVFEICFSGVARVVHLLCHNNDSCMRRVLASC